MKSLPRQPSAVVFDMDGLLFNTEELYRDAAIATAENAGHDLPLPFYLSTLGLTTDTARIRFKEHLGEDFPFDAFWTDTKTAFEELVASRLELKAGVPELLDELDRMKLGIAIATSSSAREVRRNLEAHDMTDRFHGVVAKGDYEHGKPNPAPFLTAAQRLGVSPETCLALEDSHNGVRAASSAGMMTVMVPDLLEATDEMHSLCVCIASDLVEVRNLITAT